MQKSQKLTTSILLVACIAHSLFFPNSVNTALVSVLYACMLVYFFSKRELLVLSRIKIMIAAFMFSMLITAVCIAAAELLRGYFLFDGVLMGCPMFLAMGAVIQTLFSILQEFLPDLVQVALLVLADLCLTNIGVLSAMMFSTLSEIGLTGANTKYILPWDLLGIALCIVLAEGVLFAGIHRLHLYFRSRQQHVIIRRTGTADSFYQDMGIMKKTAAPYMEKDEFVLQFSCVSKISSVFRIRKAGRK